MYSDLRNLPIISLYGYMTYLCWANYWKYDLPPSDLSEQFVEYLELVLSHSSITNPCEIPYMLFLGISNSIYHRRKYTIGILYSNL